MNLIHLFLSFLQVYLVASSPLGPYGSLSNLVKRKGGGGGGHSSGGGGSHSSGGGSHPSSGSSGSHSEPDSSGSHPASSGSSGSSSGAHPPATGTTAGHTTYGGVYGGGAAVPYLAGGRSARGLTPLALIPVAGLGFFAGAWLYGAYLYHYTLPYSFYNATSGMNQTEPVLCLCQQYSECGCDDNEDPTYMDSVIGTGSPAAMNASLVQVSDYNGTQSIIINGTLPNGTYTAPNGTTVTVGKIASGASGPMSKSYVLGWCGLMAAVFVML